MQRALVPTQKGIKLHRITLRRLVGLVALVAGMAGGVTANAAAATHGTITGAGSSLIAPLMNLWANDFQARANYQVTYGAVGSGAGISQISARTVDFGASDAPLTSAQAQGCNGCTQIPWALTATVMAYNIPGVKGLHLTGPTIAKIYRGQITNWSDSHIKKLNPHLHLPNMTITPAYRSDGSGDTYVFTDWLSRIDGQWKSKVGNATSVSFPKGVGGKGNDGVTAIIASTKGAIGYISAAYAIAHNLHVAALQNRAGHYEYPNLSNISAAAATIKHVPANNEMHIVNPPKSATKAYPMSTFTYCILPTSSPKADVLKQFVLYALGSQGQKFGPALDFAPVPSVVVSAAKTTLNGVHS
jgi:phosphate transport system substrate-binding protein